MGKPEPGPLVSVSGGFIELSIVIIPSLISGDPLKAIFEQLLQEQIPVVNISYQREKRENRITSICIYLIQIIYTEREERLKDF